MRAGPAVPARTAGQHPLAPHTPGVDGAERWRGEGDEHARMVGDLGGDAFAAGQPGPDELVGVGPVDLGAGRAAGGPARLAGDRQDPAGLVHGRVAVDQLAGGPVDVIDAATQQHGLQAATGVPDRACWDGDGGQRWYSSRRALAGGGRAEADRSQVRWVSGRVDQRCCAAWEPGSDCLPLRASCVAGGTVTRVPGDLPARLLHGHPSMRGGPMASMSNTYPKYVPDKTDTSSII